ncbi:adhesion G-protein coupled receptor G2 [Labrus bergylta]|uniref:adhesion G-protein coupled receptor G2 n=1 Tax=Labrus bergylta TaxID=56723 RepID=UPI0033131398
MFVVLDLFSSSRFHLQKGMFCENEDGTMGAPGICANGPSYWHTFSHSARLKKAGSHVPHPHWLHIQLLVLLVLLAGQASCNQAPVAYHFDLTVDFNGQVKNESQISDWLSEVFQNKLMDCMFTTAAPTSLNTFIMTTTTLQNDSTSMAVATTMTNSNTTAPTSSVSTSSNTTEAPTSTMSTSSNTTAPTSTVSTSSNTTEAPTTTMSTNSNTTAPTSSVSTSSNTTEAPTSTVSTSSNTTEAPTTTVSTSSNTTEAPTTTMSTSSNTTAPTSSVSTSSNTTEAPTTTVSTSSNTTEAPTSTVSTSSSTTEAPTTTVSTSSNTTEAPTSTVSTSSNTTEAPTSTVSTSSSTTEAPTTTMSTRSSSTEAPTTTVSTSSSTTEAPTTTMSTSSSTTEAPTTTMSTRSSSTEAPTTTVSTSSSTTEAPTTTMSTSSSTTEAPTTTMSTSSSTTEAPTTTMSTSSSTTEAPTTTMSTSSSTTEAPTTTMSTSSSTTEAATSTSTALKSSSTTLLMIMTQTFTVTAPLTDSITSTAAQPPSVGGEAAQPMSGSSQSNKPRRARDLSDRVAQTRIVETTGLFQGVKVSCNETTAIKNTCSVILNLRHRVHPCCVLRILCEASQSSSDITAVGRKIDIMKPQSECNPDPQEENCCTYRPTDGASESCENFSQCSPTTCAPGNSTQPNTTLTTTLNTPTTSVNAEDQANDLLNMTRDVSQLNSSQVNQLVSQLERLLSGPNVSLALGNTSVQIVSNLLGASPEVLSNSSNRIIQLVDTVGSKLVLEEAVQTVLSPDVALLVTPADGTNFQETFFSISNPNDVQLNGGSRLSGVRADSSIPQGSIRLPPSLTQNLSSGEQQLASRVHFNFYQKSTVFQDRSLGVRRLNSGILGASVANLSISGLQDNVTINLRNTEPIPANFVAICVFWDFTMNDGSGGWNQDGCSVLKSTDNETVCGCNHLTSFAILLDLSRTPLTSRVQATILTFITYIGCGISAIFLSITLLTYLAFGKLRKDIPSKILIQLCMALLLLNLVFLVDAWLALYPNALGLCISTAWFLHYFLLVAFTWMGLEAVHMYLALVKVFNSYISCYMLKFSLVGWGVPMIVVIIVIAIDKNNYGLVSYGRFADGTSDDFCWLQDDTAFYVAVVAYFCVIFLFNVVMFVVVLVQLCRLKRQNPHNSLHRSILQDARSVAGITILLGLTWGFAFFAWGPVNLPFMYLFAIFNSLQGFFIFIFHCAVKESVRKQWRMYLCCGKMRLAENSEWSHTATQKTMKKSSVTRLTPDRSSKLSQTNSSSSFLVPDPSEQLNGISSPFEDQAITTDEEPNMDVVLNEINRQSRQQQAS